MLNRVVFFSVLAVTGVIVAACAGADQTGGSGPTASVSKSKAVSGSCRELQRKLNRLAGKPGYDKVLDVYLEKNCHSS